METINVWLDRQDLYRCGYPYTPLPRPLHDRPLGVNDALSRVTRDLNRQINDLVHAHGVDPIQGALASSQWRFDDHGTEPRQTVSLYTHFVQSDSTGWGDLVKAVAGLFQAQGFMTAQIEIINPDKTYYAPITRELMVSSEIRYRFRAAYDGMILTAKDFLENRWLSIELGMCKRQLEASVPTVVLYVEEDTACNWDQLLKALQKQIGGDVRVRLQPAQLVPARSSLFPPIPGNGGSISTAGNPNSFGTIGVHVKVTVPEGIPCPFGLSVGSNPCVLTCHHIIAPTVPEQSWEEAFYDGIRALSDHNTVTKQKVLYPGRGLLRRTWSQLGHSLAEGKAALETLKNHPASRSTEQQDTINRHAAAIKDLQAGQTECVDLLATKRYQLGRVVASSGSTNDSYNFHQDVAIISIRQGFVSPNLVPGYDDIYWKSIKGRTITSIQEPQPNDLVLKEGARTGVTQGNLNAREHIIIKCVHPANKDITIHVEADAWSVKASDSARSTGNGKFSAAGDSGALVMHTACAWVGQIHSGLDDGQGNVTTYMSPATNVLETARTLLPGCQVELWTEPPRIPATTQLLNCCGRLFKGLGDYLT